MIADSIGTTVGPLLGTSSTSTYIESAAGIEAAAELINLDYHLLAVWVAVIYFSPEAQTIPAFAVAPALIYVGLLMLRNIVHIPVNNPTNFISSMTIVIMIPLTFSIADGLGMGIISYVILKLLTGKIKELNSMIIGLAAVFFFFTSLIGCINRAAAE